MPNKQKISVILTNWNGEKILKKHLPSVIKNSPEAQEITVIDNGSEDNSLSYLKSLQKKHGKLKIILLKKNHGFGYASNLAVKKAKGELVVLLNNDVSPHKNYLKNSINHFSDPEVFGVSFNEGDCAWAKIYWKNGYFQHYPGYQTKKAHITAWVNGGSSIIRRDLFLKLKGFDHLYHPFFWEDVDLGYRAWKSGYRLLWEPESRVDHKHESTISRLPRSFIDRIKERNQLLFVWKNITDSKLILTHRLAQIARVIFGPNYIKVILFAKIRFKKFSPKPEKYALSDQEVFALFHD